MIAQYNRRSFVFGIPGFVLQVAGTFQRTPDGLMTLPGAGLTLLGTGLLLVGLAYCAKAKGQHPAWCLLAFLSIIGLIALAILKDKAGSTQSDGEEHEQA
jgi:hypothetical protein